MHQKGHYVNLECQFELVLVTKVIFFINKVRDYLISHFDWQAQNHLTIQMFI
jgi:hypothetical protein